MTEIPELENIKSKTPYRHFKGSHWSDDNDDTLRRYYMCVPTTEIMKFLPGRTQGQIRSHVQYLKSQGKWRQTESGEVR